MKWSEFKKITDWYCINKHPSTLYIRLIPGEIKFVATNIKRKEQTEYYRWANSHNIQICFFREPPGINFVSLLELQQLI